MQATSAKLAEDVVTVVSASKFSLVAFPAFSLLNIILVFLTFTLNNFNSNAPF